MRIMPVSRAAGTIALAPRTTAQQALKSYEDRGILYLRGTPGSHEAAPGMAVALNRSMAAPAAALLCVADLSVMARTDRGMKVKPYGAASN